MLASLSDRLLLGPYVMVYHTGEVVFPVLMKLRTTCKVNIQYFPFDRQVCGLKFASWIYDVSSIKYELVAITNEQQQSENIRNSGWTILGVKQGLVWRYVRSPLRMIGLGYWQRRNCVNRRLFD